MAKEGFGGQWIQICRVGKAVDSKGVDRDLKEDFVKNVVANYNAGDHEAPIVVGHPETEAPAFGWASELRLNGADLEARFSDTDEEFEKSVAAGRFKKRSASFYLDPPNLRHVGFLGAVAPAIKGLRDIKFAEGESFALEQSINLQETQMKEEDLDKLPDSYWSKIKAKLGMGSESEGKGTSTQFSEASVKDLVTGAVKDVEERLTADFAEKLKAKDAELQAINEKIAAGTASGRRTEIVAFVESIPAEKGKHFLRNAGIVEFMESLAVADAADKTPAIVCFSEEKDGKKEEHKLSRVDWFKNYVNAQKSFVEFGEKFGNITAMSEADVAVDRNRVDAMKDAAGVKKTEGGKD